jgi:hypothetical protein
MNKLFFVLFVTILLSCEKDITFDLKESPNQLVVEAEIENDKAPTVILTKSFSYFSNINPQLLEQSFVHNADIFISNGSLTHKLKEYSYIPFPGYMAYYYSIDSASLSTAFSGAFNTSYSLRIISEGKEYNAVSNIPALATFPDSVYFKQAPFLSDTNKRRMFVKASDPIGLGNFVRYFTKRNSGPFLPGRASVYSDEVIDGTTYDVSFPQGIDRNFPLDPDSNFYSRGDTVTLKFCNIDKASYTFWNTWEFAYQSIGNPFSQPNKVLGNVSNGALGSFCGYAAWYRRKIVQ